MCHSPVLFRQVPTMGADSPNLHHLLGDKNYTGEDWIFPTWKIPLGKHLKPDRDWRHLQSDNKAEECVAVLLRTSQEFPPLGSVGLGALGTTQSLPDMSKWGLSVTASGSNSRNRIFRFRQIELMVIKHTDANCWLRFKAHKEENGPLKSNK